MERNDINCTAFALIKYIKRTNQLSEDKYKCGDDIQNQDAIILRSFQCMTWAPSSLKAVARAGAVVNNIQSKVREQDCSPPGAMQTR